MKTTYIDWTFYIDITEDQKISYWSYLRFFCVSTWILQAFYDVGIVIDGFLLTPTRSKLGVSLIKYLTKYKSLYGLMACNIRSDLGEGNFQKYLNIWMLSIVNLVIIIACWAVKNGICRLCPLLYNAFH